jgi:hypothetical protein
VGYPGLDLELLTVAVENVDGAAEELNEGVTGLLSVLEVTEEEAAVG